MALKNEYIFFNRYNESVKMIKNGDKYRLEMESDYYRVGFGDSETDIHFIDPSGGPFLAIGSKFFDFTINDISKTENGFLFTLKENE